MAGEMTVFKMSASVLTASSLVGNPKMTTPRCRRAANDGRSRRIRRLNVELVMSPGASLHLFIGSFWSINVKRMERLHQFIASFISDLAR